ncbi:hypothetical protein AC629_31490 [Bradyrhizobium sp. NAS80.1]|nr:hypothetical protein AC629_31490 [Bradyrhizobium sp. NAS80.1]
MIGALVAQMVPRLIQINGLPFNGRQKWRVAFDPRRVFIIEVVGLTTVVPGVPALVKRSGRNEQTTRTYP